jgi:Uma2 family endonuclease
MSTDAGTLITAEEFFRMPDPPDGSRQELVRGVVISMPPPGFRHGDVQFNVGFFLGQYARTHRLGRVTLESGVRTERGPDSVRGPDVAFWSFERLPRDVAPIGYPDEVADFVAEVLSPGQTPRSLRDKVQEYLAAGVRMVWLVDPDARCVTVIRSGVEDRTFQEGDTLSGEDVLPGFSVPVAELFAS